MNMIRYAEQYIDDKDIQAVVDVLRSDYLTCGPKVEQFEQAIAKYTGAQYALAVSSATTALHLACRSLGLTQGTRLWTTPNTFVASANCGLYCGATIDFVDIELETYNLSVSALTEKLIQAQKNNTLPDVLVPVHFAGASCNMEQIYKLSKEYGFKIIEDASHAIGGKYGDKHVGSCLYSDFAVLSLHPVKIITTGEGGVLLTNNEALYQSAKLLRSHGITRDHRYYEGEDHGPWYYQAIELGFNYRITDLQCALGQSQLTKIDSFVQKRHHLANRYDQSLHDLPAILPARKEYAYSALHLYPIRILDNVHHKDRKQVFIELQQKGIGVNVHYIPVHTQPLYRKMGFKEHDFPNALHYYQQAISLPLHYGLSEDQQDYVIQCLYEILL